MLQLLSEFLDAPNSSEADHRIANHLSLIASLLRLQTKTLAGSQTFSREDAVWLLNDCSRRVDTVARVHRLLAAQSEQNGWIDVREYLREIAEGIVESTSGDGKYTLKSDCEIGCLVQADHVASLGLLIGELITNAIKYAHPAGVPGVITLSCSRAPDNSSIVTISDDGVGLPEGFDPATSGNLGFRTIRSLTQRLQGEADFDSSCLGLSVTVRFPTPKESSTVIEFGRMTKS
ncbi:sensor histidine kinase [Methylocapsa palsarum]|uniref:histidine kinase n=1 Tax=Methylocapsa palsarum TaxID=1612308 RepID=A0A1I4CV00_9HYPH|nr:sensor histidine kinase [Methylocapsa palsarum]SFK85144.1 Two-component sensor histidine kinase, contains HisKA and HATPase domains [Methylocapsa palsarum]